MPKCKGEPVYQTTEGFLKKLKEYSESELKEYDFSSTVYSGSKEKIKIICNICKTESEELPQEFLRLAREHKSLCRKCRSKSSKNNKPTTDEFRDKLIIKFGNMYDYSHVDYVNSHTPIKLVCKSHGSFFEKPNAIFTYPENFIFCPECRKLNFENKRNEHLIKKFNDAHKDLIGRYNNIHYITKTEVEFDCPKHGVVRSFATTFLERGCRFCSHKTVNRNYTTEEFVNMLKELYKDKYDYSKVVYKTYNHDKVCLTCKKHGDFWRLPVRLLEGRGCPKCRESLLEKEIFDYLNDLGLEYVYQYRNREILGRQSIDFYLPEYSSGIECQGKQHFDKDSKYNLDIDMSEVYEKDKLKYEKCKKSGIKIYYFSHVKTESYEYIDKIYNDKCTLIDTIIKTHEKGLL